MIVYFVIYNEKVLLELKLKGGIPENLIKAKIKKALKKQFARKPGHFIYLDYNLDIDESYALITPKNAYTALLFWYYEFPPAFDKPFKAWKEFIIIYDENCTGYFMA
jgi:hypothetical protein